jgi:hypothetical protein
MSSFLDGIVAEAESEESLTVFLLFKQKSSTIKKRVHAFYEGFDDSSFYSGFLERFFPVHELVKYECGSKKKVYTAFADINPEVLSNDIALFFLDKDFSDFIPENNPVAKNIYVTDYYSIENHLVSEEMLSKVWRDTFHITKGSIEVDRFQNKFLQELKKFYEYITPLMAWIIALRRKSDTQQLVFGEAKLLSKFYSFDNELTLTKSATVIQSGEINEFATIRHINPSVVSQPELDAVIQELASTEPKKFVRGKYELWFFIKFLDKLRELLEQRKVVNVSLQISEGNAIQILSGKFYSLASLEEFLRNNTPIL